MYDKANILPAFPSPNLTKPASDEDNPFVSFPLYLAISDQEELNPVAISMIVLKVLINLVQLA